MATDIRTRLTSSYISLSNRFRRKSKIQVYVEDSIDKEFLYCFLHPYEKPNNCYFVISILRDRDKTLKGKASLLSYKKEEDLGPYMWICVDSDFDEIVNDYSEFSDIIRRNKYVLTTWWYSIENLKCFPSLLQEDVMKASLADKIEEDFEGILRDISSIYKEIFLLLLEMKESNDNRFTIDEFNRCLSYVSFKEGLLDRNAIITKLSTWNSNHTEWYSQHSSKFDAWQERLSELGFEVGDYYQIFNGHGLYNNVAVPMVIYYSKKYRNEQIDLIRNGADSADRKNQLTNEYHKETFTTNEDGRLRRRVEQLITDNCPSPDCSASSRIGWQIERALGV